jgi:hypothetical protein
MTTRVRDSAHVTDPNDKDVTNTNLGMLCERMRVYARGQVALLERELQRKSREQVLDALFEDNVFNFMGIVSKIAVQV